MQEKRIFDILKLGYFYLSSEQFVFQKEMYVYSRIFFCHFESKNAQ